MREITGVKTRLNGIDSRLGGIDSRLDGIDSRLDGIDLHLNGIDSHLDGIEGVNRRIMAMLSQLVGDVTDMRRELATKAELAALRSEMNQRFDGFVALHKEMQFSRALHHQRLDDHDKRLKKLERRPS